MKDRRENKVENDLRTATEAAGGACLKLPAILYRGIPDRLLLLPGGRAIFVELKRKSGRPPSVHQVRFRNFLCSLGFLSVTIRGDEDLQIFIETHLA